jgi:hypothetical protein
MLPVQSIKYGTAIYDENGVLVGALASGMGQTGDINSTVTVELKDGTVKNIPWGTKFHTPATLADAGISPMIGPNTPPYSPADTPDPTTWPVEGVFGQKPGTKVYDPSKGIIGEIQPKMGTIEAVPIKWPPPYGTEMVYPQTVQQEQGFESPTQYPTLHAAAGPTWEGVKHFTPPGLKIGSGIGGTQGAKMAFDADKQKWTIKSYGGNQERVSTEALASTIYQALGVDVPEGGLIDVNGQTAYGAKWVEGSPKKITAKVKQESGQLLGAGFMADALLANWDVIGAEDDNIIWGAGGVPYRVDVGGTLGFRAMGAKKAFGDVPVEVWTMLKKGRQAERSMIVTPAMKKAQAAHIADVLSPEVLKQMVQTAGFPPGSAQNKLYNTLVARVQWMRDFADGKVSEGGN